MTDNELSRRDALAAGGLSLAASVSLIETVRAEEHADVSLTFEDQQSNGLSVVVQRVEASIDVRVVIFDEEPLNDVALSAGVHEDVTIRISGGLTGEQTLSARLYPADGGSRLIKREARISVDEDTTVVSGFEPQLVGADPEAGFEYPYYLYAPTTADDGDPKPLVVEPTNTGTATNDFEQHRRAGEDTARGGLSRDIADSLAAPLLVPVFPRPRGDPVDGTHYVHQLDDTTMEIDSGPLERVDRQLIRMIEHARRRLGDRGYPVSDEGVMLNGFSASGNFVDRFAVLHPEEVISVTAGGLNGMALLPHERYDGRELPYHVGLANAEELIGETPNLEALSDVNQLLYMGEEDTNDTIPFDDAWTDDDLRQLALDVYGEEMITDRFPTCQQAYRDAGIEAQFRVYEDAGHTPRPAIQDIIEFHRRSIHGEDVSEFGQTIVAAPRIESSAQTPATGEAVTFDGGDSTGGIDEVIAYLWEFGDGTTATGTSTTHAYSETGSYTVTLRIITDSGSQFRTTTSVNVETDGQASNEQTNDSDDTAGDSDSTDEESTNTEADDGTTDSTGDDSESANETDEPTDTDDQTSDDGEATEAGNSADDGGPGFGVPAALAGVGGAASLLKSRLDQSGDPD